MVRTAVRPSYLLTTFAVSGLGAYLFSVAQRHTQSHRAKRAQLDSLQLDGNQASERVLTVARDNYEILRPLS